MSTVRRSNEQVRSGKGQVDARRARAATDADIERWKREDGVDDTRLGAASLVRRSPDVRAIRERLGLSQEAFAQRFQISLRTVQEWEQRRRVPEGPALTLLRVIERDPQAVERALAST